MIATVIIKLNVPVFDEKVEGAPRAKFKPENDLWSLWESPQKDIETAIKDWAENEFGGIAEYQGVVSVEVSIAPAV